MPEDTGELSASMGTDDKSRTASWRYIRTGMFEVLLTSFDEYRNATCVYGAVSSQSEAEQACATWVRQGISVLAMADG